MEWFGVANNARKTLEKCKGNWKVKLTSAGDTLGEVKIKRGTFQGDRLSPLLFVLTLIPLSMVLNEAQAGYQLGKDRSKINYLLFMDDLKLYAKNAKKLDSLVQKVKIYSEDMSMKFGIQKCAVVEMKRGKMLQREGIELFDEETIKSLEEDEGYKYKLPREGEVCKAWKR